MKNDHDWSHSKRLKPQYLPKWERQSWKKVTRSEIRILEYCLSAAERQYGDASFHLKHTVKEEMAMQDWQLEVWDWLYRIPLLSDWRWMHLRCRLITIDDLNKPEAMQRLLNGRIHWKLPGGRLIWKKPQTVRLAFYCNIQTGWTSVTAAANIEAEMLWYACDITRRITGSNRVELDFTEDKRAAFTLQAFFWRL
jgi:hypothetical protein